MPGRAGAASGEEAILILGDKAAALYERVQVVVCITCQYVYTDYYFPYP